MKGVILAAGIGSRLRPITNNKPKCLTNVFGKPILEHQLNALLDAGIREVVVVTGYMSEKVERFLGTFKNLHKLNVTIIRNTAYESTNNMYSLYLATKELYGHSFVLLNGDVVFEPEVAKILIQNHCEDLIAVDRSVFFDESMKVRVNDKGFISDISKQIPKEESYGTSIDFYKFSQVTGKIFLDFVKHIIEKEGNLKDWTEVAMQRLFREEKLKMKPLDISGMKWIEIDNVEDLLLAYKIFPRIDVRKKKAFFFHCGTIHKGDTLLPGAKEAVRKLLNEGKLVYFISSNSSKCKRDYLDKLLQLGIEASEDQLILCNMGVPDHPQMAGTSELCILMIEKVIKRNELSVNEVVFIGNSLHRDLPFAKNLGADFILVLSGEVKVEDLDSEGEIPGIVVKDIGEIFEVY
ncbi:MAG: hypothetical protein PWQ72_2020 [Pseudothermotoga sp.]|nr:hypothetical protein [Pseudothermotoga sp.]